MATLATLPYAIRVRPRISSFAVVVSTGQAVPLIGLDVLAQATDAGALDMGGSTGGKIPEFHRSGDASNLDGVWVG